MNVLVTSLSRKVPLVEALKESPGSGLVWGGDSDPECVGRWFVDRFWLMPSLAAEDARREVVEFCEREEIGLLLPTRDGELAFFAALRDQLSARGTYVAVGVPAAVDTCLDKLAFFEHCRRTGIATAHTALSADELGAERLVVKDRYGAGSGGVGVGLDRAAARAYAERIPEPVFQPVLEGVEHSVDVYVNRAGAVVDAAPRTRIRVREGESTVTETVEHPGLADAAARLAESLELRGHLVIQGFALGDDAVLLECNPRVGGASTLGFRAGIDTPAWAIAEAGGEIVEPCRGAYKRGLRMVRYPADRLIEP